MRFPLFRTASAFAVVVLAGFGAAACGGDDGGGGSDAEYVSAVCGAVLQFQDDFTEVIEGATGDETTEEAVELFVEPLENYVANLKEANPPEDIEGYHSEVVQTTEDALNRVKEENSLDALNDVGEPEPPSEEIQARLESAAAEDENCQEADFTFGG